VSVLQVCTKDFAQSVGVFVVEMSKAVAQTINVLSRELDTSAQFKMFLAFFPDTVLKLLSGTLNIAVGLVTGKPPCLSLA
jgi:hypothetical protein